MSIVPDDWNDPESFNGMLYEIGWFVLAILVFSIAPFFFSFHYTRSFTPTLAIVSIGITLGTILVYVSHTRGFVRNAWKCDKLRFAVLLTVSLLIQALLWLIPLWTTAVAIATFITAIPIRVFVYLRTQSATRYEEIQPNSNDRSQLRFGMRRICNPAPANDSRNGSTKRIDPMWGESR